MTIKGNIKGEGKRRERRSRKEGRREERRNIFLKWVTSLPPGFLEAQQN